MVKEKKQRIKPKLISLISGGIDSPVATYLMLAQGAELICLYLDNRPFTDEKTKNKVIGLVDQLRSFTKQKLKLYIVAHGPNQKLYARNCDRHVGCILCRRMMFRIGQEIANREGAVGLLTGESMGQVASQTLQNIAVESQAINLPILRPLIGLDKLEIEKIGKEIGTYNISISPGLCCTIVPNKPSTKADLDRILAEESKVDIETMLEDAMKNVEVL
jgi:thiamine biosynthesis protein ThiI